MEANRKRNIKDGRQYDHLFPWANTDNHTIMSNAGVGDTVAFIPKVVKKTLHQTAGIAQVLRTASPYETCRRIWHFVYDHIAYRRDKEGYEQVRSPSRVWHDRAAGVDCDCYTTFISSILNHCGIRHQLRITKYSRPHFQHIYPVATVNGKEVILDCVTDKFDFEVPYSEKKDFPMDLQYLDGLDGDDRLFDGTDGMDELGKLLKKKAAAPAKKANPAPAANNKKGGILKKVGAAVKTATKTVTKAAANTVKTAGKAVATTAQKAGKAVATTAKNANLKKVLNVVNKVNPATVALRNGLLAGMKLNVSNVAGRLRWSYLNADQARAKGIQMDRWNKLVQTRQKLEQIFYGAGGNPANLKSAILTGKGNSDKAVNGLYGMEGFRDAEDALYMNIRTPLPQLLGPGIYYLENAAVLGELGEPLTMTLVAAASGAIATIAGLIKKIGDIFGGKGGGSKDFEESANAGAEQEAAAIAEQAKEEGVAPQATFMPEPAALPAAPEGPGVPAAPPSTATNTASPAAYDAGGSNATTAIAPVSQPSGMEVQETQETQQAPANIPAGAAAGNFWAKHKKWLLPVGIGVGGVTILAIAVKTMGSKSPPPAKQGKPLNGPPAKKNHHRKKQARGKIKKVTLG